MGCRELSRFCCLETPCFHVFFTFLCWRILVMYYSFMRQVCLWVSSYLWISILLKKVNMLPIVLIMISSTHTSTQISSHNQLCLLNCLACAVRTGETDLSVNEATLEWAQILSGNQESHCRHHLPTCAQLRQTCLYCNTTDLSGIFITDILRPGNGPHLRQTHFVTFVSD